MSYPYNTSCQNSQRPFGSAQPSNLYSNASSSGPFYFGSESKLKNQKAIDEPSKTQDETRFHQNTGDLSNFFKNQAFLRMQNFISTNDQNPKKSNAANIWSEAPINQTLLNDEAIQEKLTTLNKPKSHSTEIQQHIAPIKPTTIENHIKQSQRRATTIMLKKDNTSPSTTISQNVQSSKLDEKNSEKSPMNPENGLTEEQRIELAKDIVIAPPILSEYTKDFPGWHLIKIFEHLLDDEKDAEPVVQKSSRDRSQRKSVKYFFDSSDDEYEEEEKFSFQRKARLARKQNKGDLFQPANPSKYKKSLTKRQQKIQNLQEDSFDEIDTGIQEPNVIKKVKKA